jgi:biopolymer transport protein ExbB/TolQ
MTEASKLPLSSAISIAQSSPAGVLLRGSFWLSQGWFLLVCFGGAAAIILLVPYTYDNVKGFRYLTIMIHALAMWGAWLTIRSIAVLHVEMAILNVIDTRALNLLRSVKAKQIAPIDLDSLEARVLPDNKAMPVPAMIRLFQHICKEARDRKFDSSVNVLDSYREEPLEDLFRLQNLQKIALWLGILGTFIGLMLAIQSGNIKDVPTMADFAKIVQSMFADLYISFSASLAGLEVAVILGFFLLVLRKKQKLYFERMESAVLTMLSLARNSINRDDFLTEFSQVSTAMSQLTDSVSAQTTVLSNRLDGLQKQIIVQNEQITLGLQSLMNTGKEFDRFLTSMTDGQRQFIEDIRNVYDTVSLKRMGATLQQSIVNAGHHMAETIKPNVTLISDRLSSFNRLVTELNESFENQSKTISQNLEKLGIEVKGQTSSSQTGLELFKHQMSLELSRKLALSKTEVQELRQSITTLNQSVQRMTTQISTPSARFVEKLRRFKRRLLEGI